VVVDGDRHIHSAITIPDSPDTDNLISQTGVSPVVQSRTSMHVLQKQNDLNTPTNPSWVSTAVTDTSDKYNTKEMVVVVEGGAV